MQMHNFLDFFYPGLYEIYCEQTHRSYFGESENVVYRLGRHFNDLESENSHESLSLQNDWIVYGRQAFVFRILEAGPEWVDKQKRRLREKEYITGCDHDVYNQSSTRLRSSNFSNLGRNQRKEWTIDGVTYASGAEAARRLGKSPSSIYRLMKQKGDFQTFFGTKPVSIEGRLFPSVTEAQNSLGIAKSTLYRRLRSPKYPDWFFIEKTRSNDYPERE